MVSGRAQLNREAATISPGVVDWMASSLRDLEERAQGLKTQENRSQWIPFLRREVRRSRNGVREDSGDTETTSRHRDGFEETG